MSGCRESSKAAGLGRGRAEGEHTMWVDGCRWLHPACDTLCTGGCGKGEEAAGRDGLAAVEGQLGPHEARLGGLCQGERSAFYDAIGTAENSGRGTTRHVARESGPESSSLSDGPRQIALAAWMARWPGRSAPLTRADAPFAGGVVGHGGALTNISKGPDSGPCMSWTDLLSSTPPHTVNNAGVRRELNCFHWSSREMKKHMTDGWPEI